MEKIILEHGSGGQSTGALIDEVFASAFDNEVLLQMEDSAVVPGSGTLAITTDSFVVTPLEFPGGDIGRLAICGTVNDLLTRGAVPKYITCGFILQEGASIEQLKRLTMSMAKTAEEAGVVIVAGDTKVVEGDGGIFINTTGVGFVASGVDISARNSQVDDVILVSGTLGEHHAAILSSRMEIRNTIMSDAAPLTAMVSSLMNAGIVPHVLRDVTRGGLATVLKELAVTSGLKFDLEEEWLPVQNQVRDFCGLLGLEPLYMGNEGKMVMILPASMGEQALEIIKTSPYGQDAAMIGRVSRPLEHEPGRVVLHTRFGGHRILERLQGEGLPRIC